MTDMTPIRAASRWGILVLAWSIVAGCGERTGADSQVEPNKSLIAAIRDADELVLYEGLPHQGNERELFNREKQRTDTLTLQDYPFYNEPLNVSDDEKKALRALLGDEQSFTQWRGEKKCGGFHPDYLAEWQVGKATYRFLLCFGCHEAMVYGPGSSLRCDIQLEAFKQIEALFKKHRKNRPPENT